MAIHALFGLFGFWKPIREILNNLILSFKTEKGGFSARKLSACFATFVAAVLSYKHGDNTTVTILVAIWLAYALLNSGLVTFADLIKWKHGNGTETTKTEETTIIEKSETTEKLV